MVRKLVRPLLGLLLMFPAAVWALGLGDIRVHSVLNEPLNADIELLSVDRAEVPTIQAALASYEAFTRVGIDRTANLMFLKFDVEQRGDRHVIHVSSERPIREPFLDFLIEVQWRSGRLLREYTILLDPPELTRSPPPPVTAPRSTAPVANAATPRRSTARPSSARAARSAKPLVYGPVRENETLWSIAREMRPNRSVSIPQLMTALVKANPEAFDDGNVHRLKSGYVLRIDDPALLKAMSKAEAAREVQRHTREWEDFKRRAAAEAGRRTPSSASRVTAASGSAERQRLRLVSPEDKKTAPPKKEKVAPSAPAPSEPKQEARQGAVSPALADLQRQLILAQESTEAQRRENEELRARLEQLEGQLSSMQRLLSLKDEDLASLQHQLRREAEQVVAEGQAQAVAPVAPAAPQPVNPAEAVSAQPVQAAAEPAVQSADEVQPQPAPKPAAPAAPRPKPVAPRPAPEPDPLQFVFELIEDPVVVGGLSGVGLIFLLLLWMVVRRRRAGDFQESILQGGTSSMLTTRKDPVSGESSFLSDIAISDMGAIHADESEVDPLTEADVYMAYGRHQQAEDLLKEAIEAQPDRQELLVKLLELYYTTKNKAAFEERATQAFSELDGTSALWAKVQSMGHELAPDNPMFTQAPDEVAAAVEEPSGRPLSEEDVLDIGIDLDDLAAEMEPSEEEAAAAGAFDTATDEEELEPVDELDLDVDFSSLEEQEEADGHVPERSMASGGAADLTRELPDLDLSGLELPDMAAETGAVEQLVEEQPLLEQAETAAPLEPELEGPAAVEEPPAAEAAPDEGNLLDFDLSDLDLTDGANSGTSEEEHFDEAHSMDFDIGELDLGEDESTSEDAGALEMPGLEFEASGAGLVPSLERDETGNESGELPEIDLDGTAPDDAPAEAPVDTGSEEPDPLADFVGLQLDEVGQAPADLSDQDEDQEPGLAEELPDILTELEEAEEGSEVGAAESATVSDELGDSFDIDIGELDAGYPAADSSEETASPGAETPAAVEAMQEDDLDLGELEDLGELGEDPFAGLALPEEDSDSAPADEADEWPDDLLDLAAALGDEPEAAPGQAAVPVSADTEAAADLDDWPEELLDTDSGDTAAEPGGEPEAEAWPEELLGPDTTDSVAGAEVEPEAEAWPDEPAELEDQAEPAHPIEHEIPSPAGSADREDDFSGAFDLEDAAAEWAETEAQSPAAEADGPAGADEGPGADEPGEVVASTEPREPPAAAEDLEPLPADEAPPVAATGGNDGFDGLDLDAVEAELGDSDDDALFDLDLDAFEADEPAAVPDTAAAAPSGPTEDAPAAMADAPDLEDLELEMDLDALRESAEGDEDDEDDSWLSELDEVATKLDLARAYIDMGDEEGARAVLGEVVEEGNDDQRQQARDLLSQIA